MKNEGREPQSEESKIGDGINKYPRCRQISSDTEMINISHLIVKLK